MFTSDELGLALGLDNVIHLAFLAGQGAGRWSVSHGGIVNSLGRDEAGRPIEASGISHAFRAANGTGVFISMPWTATTGEEVNELRRDIGLTHKLVGPAP